MKRDHRSALTAVVLFAAMPLAWLACGGGKPPETPADEAASAESSAEPATSGSEESAGSAAPAESAAPPAETAAATPPPPAAPPFGDSDCGKCIDKTCARQAAACGKNSDCQSAIDSIHSCGSDKGAATCIGNANNPSTGKPKKLAAAYEKCAKKATTSKACKSKCSQ